MRRLGAALIALLASLAPLPASSGVFSPPVNDNFVNATPITSLPFSEETTTTTDASVEAGEPLTNSCVTGDPPAEGSVAKTVWYTFTPGADLNFAADTFGSVATDEAYDTVIVLWKGTALEGLDEVACNDDSGPDLYSHSRVGFPLKKGTKYYVQIGSWTGNNEADPPVAVPADTGTLQVHAGIRTFLPGSVRPRPEENNVSEQLNWFLAKPGLTGVESFQMNTDFYRPLAGTTCGDGISKPAAARVNWYINFWFDDSADMGFNHGSHFDFPLLGDYEGDTLASAGLVRGNTWFLIDSRDRSLLTFKHGRATDYPVVGDWDGNGSQTPGLIRGNVWFISNQVPPTSLITFAFAKSTDTPVVGDWDGDGSMEPGAVRSNVWYLADAAPPTALLDTFVFAGGRDFPIAGDWDGAVTGLGVGGFDFTPSSKLAKCEAWMPD